MVELTMWEKLLTVAVQIALYVLVPWQTSNRLDVVMVLVVLGIVSVAIVGSIEWFLEHALKITIPG